MTLKTSHVVENRCPHCNYQTDAASPVLVDCTPSENDMSLCIECGEWSVFGPNLKLRVPTDDEFTALAEDATFRRVRAAWVASRRDRRT